MDLKEFRFESSALSAKFLHLFLYLNANPPKQGRSKCDQEKQDFETEQNTVDPHPLNSDVGNTVPRMSSRLYLLKDLLRFQ